MVVLSMRSTHGAMGCLYFISPQTLILHMVLDLLIFLLDTYDFGTFNPTTECFLFISSVLPALVIQMLMNLLVHYLIFNLDDHANIVIKV
jgi:hypothetical protein